MYTHLQIRSGCIKETLTEFKLLNGKIDIVAIGELIEGGWNTSTLLNPEGKVDNRGGWTLVSSDGH